jgi:polyisoprenoid-binding protein YceI
MKKIVIIICICFQFGTAIAQDIYVSKDAVISFFSKTPLEDIDATTKTAVSALNIKTKAIYFKVEIKKFKFKKKLMQEHFNENYLESDKFPIAEFTGNLANQVDVSKDGNYNMDVIGKLTIHGVTKEYKTKALVIVKNGKIIAQAKLPVRLADHNIEIPTLVTKQIAEIVDITITATYIKK